MNPRLLNEIAPYDVASDICQALSSGGVSVSGADWVLCALLTPQRGAVDADEVGRCRLTL